ncbi:MAG TPA: YbaB/EbfC family nucleoid-associated protein [Streptosporangiaceae bacterium]|nr:YbaB/EbfC family nucleoid-associated protein [Streptosporangiaceae bacterium]
MNDPEAALRRLAELTRGYPERLAQARAKAAELRDEQISGASPDGDVTATADGQGTITGVRFSATALRRLDTVTLGERTTAAINAALDAAERRQAEDAEATGLDNALDEILDNLNYRLDGIVSRLTDVERSLES